MDRAGREDGHGGLGYRVLGIGLWEGREGELKGQEGEGERGDRPKVRVSA